MALGRGGGDDRTDCAGLISAGGACARVTACGVRRAHARAVTAAGHNGPPPGGACCACVLYVCCGETALCVAALLIDLRHGVVPSVTYPARDEIQ